MTQFPTWAHFASWNGTAPIDASSGDQVRHRLSDISCHQLNLDAQAAETGPGGHVGAATGSSAAGLHPGAGTSEKSLPGPATSDPRPGKPVPSPGRSRRFSISSGRLRAGAHYPGRE